MISLFISLYGIFFLTKLGTFFFAWKNTNAKSVLFLENFPIENAGYQYRAAKWMPYFEKEGYKVEVWTIEENKAKFDNYLANKSTAFLIKSMYKRFMQIIKSRRFETVIVRRELLLYNDYGNLFMEKFLLKFHPNAILDFDDDIAAAKGQPKEITNWYGKLMLEKGNKFNDSLKLYKRFVVGSEYLKKLVLQRNVNAIEETICVIPTCVDVEYYPIKNYSGSLKSVAFGWIGGNQNLKYLDLVVEQLNFLIPLREIKLIVISGNKYVNSKACFPIENRPWSLATEKHDLLSIDIGLLPLPINNIAKGKCGFKLLQYLACGIITISSDIGANKEIISNGRNGFLYLDNFIDVVQKAISINDAELALQARGTVEHQYSFLVKISDFLFFLNFKL